MKMYKLTRKKITNDRFADDMTMQKKIIPESLGINTKEEKKTELKSENIWCKIKSRDWAQPQSQPRRL